MIWLDDIDRIHPQGSSRIALEEVEEEASQDCMSYDEITDVKELEKLVGITCLVITKLFDNFFSN